MLEGETYSLNFDRTNVKNKISDNITLLFQHAPFATSSSIIFKQADPCGGPIFPGTGPSCLCVFPQG